MNRLLRRSTGAERYATFFLAEFDKATSGLTYVNAGHNPPMLVRSKLALHGEGGELVGVPKVPLYLSNKSIEESTANRCVYRSETSDQTARYWRADHW
jgi:sigma-B regulation protein RsbU (phosphoserine phosphatase)